MKKALLVIQVLFSLNLFGQPEAKYEVYAIKFAAYNSYFPVSQIAINPPTKDSARPIFMIWLIKGNNGKNILVDAGFQRSSSAFTSGIIDYTRPDSALHRIELKPEDITDIIITHPHSDHIDGIDLFPSANLWMQRNDYSYFVGDSWKKEGDSLDVLKIVQANLKGKLHLIDGDSVELFPGIRVFIGSKHTYESQYVMVNTGKEKIIIASDNIWFYYNLNHMVSIPLTLNTVAYIEQMKRMKRLVNPAFIIPGHDEQIFKKFPEITPGVVQIK